MSSHERSINPPLTVDRVKRALLDALGDRLHQVEALGIFGSLARGRDFADHSDIDIFVIVQAKEAGSATDQRWWQMVRQALEPFERDVTVLVYTVGALRAVANWYVLRIATEGILIYDQGHIASVFDQIVQAGHQAGLVQERVADCNVWTVRPERTGKPLEVSLE